MAETGDGPVEMLRVFKLAKVLPGEVTPAGELPYLAWLHRD